MAQFKRIPKIPSPEDREFIREVANGEVRTRAFRNAYPDNPVVKRYMDIVKKQGEPPEEGERSRLQLTIKRMSKDKVQAKYINDRLQSFSESMDVLAAKSIRVADDILDNGRSEKVKADLAIEFIRHKVGTPVQKVQAQIDKTVHLSFGSPSDRDDMSDIIEGEVLDQ